MSADEGRRMSSQPDRAGRDRDRVIVDTGWGVKPDDQPANAAEARDDVCRVYRYDPSEPDVVRRMLRAQRQGFNTANRVRVESGRTSIFDINGDAFVIEGLTFGDEKLVALLQSLGAAFSPQEFRRLSPDEPVPREFALSRAWAWGAERPS
ncbi:MAG: hypothetical protein HY718_10220 [Planctomycetes bacterium]|nr:hypothetical protein [Planctomycetota bacterium]